MPSLLDFLYSDHERVASFLSQINVDGVVTGSEKSASKGKQNSRDGKIKLGPFEGGLGVERDWNQEVRLKYDPLWSNSKKLIDYFDQNLISETDTELKCGKIVSLSGSLIAYDLSTVTGLMESEHMDDFIANGMDDDTISDVRSGKVKSQEKKKNASIVRQFIKSIPLGIGFVLVTDKGHFWFSVKKEFLSLYDLDIPLKYPIHVSGTWNVLGVVDALPHDHVEGMQPIIDRNIDGLMPAMVLHLLQLIGGIVGLFGRPLQAYGLSPLIVYRDVAN